MCTYFFLCSQRLPSYNIFYQVSEHKANQTKNDGHSTILCTKLFGTNGTKIIQLANIIFVVKKNVYIIDYHLAFFLAGLTCQVILNKDPTIWLDGAIPANTCIPPSFLENAPLQLWGVPTLKIHLQVLKISSENGQIIYRFI